MKPLFITYPKCSTCIAAKKYLDSNQIDYQLRDIMTETPSYEELTTWINTSNLPIKRFFNTSGNLYKELNLKDKLDSMSESEMIRLLSSSGWLIKRPLLITSNAILVGFHEEIYETINQ